MNKQCQQPQAHPDRCGCVREIAEHNAQAYAEAIAALAAKDARIAELEAERDEWRRLFNEAGTVSMNARSDLAQLVAKIESLEVASGFACSLADEVRAALAATPSEDGLELPEIVAYVDEHGTTVSVGRQGAWISGHDRAIPDCWDRLMTVAQHERIVAAKDAEIARLCKLAYIGEHQFEDCTYKFRLEELRAQPARQVGGDNGEAMAFADILLMWNRRHEQPPIMVGYEYGVAVAMLDAARAALAPAAVVMPDRKDVTLATQDDDWPEVVSRRMAQAHNAALDEVARLNRRAIPVGLLERICEEGIVHQSKDWQLINELRALLGKEG